MLKTKLVMRCAMALAAGALTSAQAVDLPPCTPSGTPLGLKIGEPYQDRIYLVRSSAGRAVHWYCPGKAPGTWLPMHYYVLNSYGSAYEDVNAIHRLVHDPARALSMLTGPDCTVPDKVAAADSDTQAMCRDVMKSISEHWPK